ncbi:PEP-CTERM sorting domain-containing protein [Candidatus Nitrotoga sp. 1052]
MTADASTNLIPEPATALLVLLGIGMTAWSRRNWGHAQ